MIYMILIGANILAKVFYLMGFQSWLESFIFAFELPGWPIVIIMGIIMMLLGMVFDVIALLVIVVPIFLPIVVKFGYDPVWFAIVSILFSEMALITPPIGINLFIIQTVGGRNIPLTQVALGAAPYVIAIWILLIVLLIFPQLALWLPSTMH
jgi:C4-dicarboxylate transporter DctM subunit